MGMVTIKKDEIRSLHAELSEIKDVKEGQLFGVILKHNSVFNMRPLIEVLPGDKGVQYNLELETNNTLYYSFADIPLVLRKMSKNLAQDILTYNVFIIGNICDIKTELAEISGNLEKFQTIINKFSNVRVAIDVTDSEDEKKEVYYEINDVFKSIYGELTLSREKAITEKMAEFIDDADHDYTIRLNTGIEELQNIANTENLIFDLIIDSENQNVKTKK